MKTDHCPTCGAPVQLRYVEPKKTEQKTEVVVEKVKAEMPARFNCPNKIRGCKSRFPNKRSRGQHLRFCNFKQEEPFEVESA